MKTARAIGLLISPVGVIWLITLGGGGRKIDHAYYESSLKEGKIVLNQSLIYIHPFPFSSQFFYLSIFDSVTKNYS